MRPADERAPPARRAANRPEAGGRRWCRWPAANGANVCECAEQPVGGGGLDRSRHRRSPTEQTRRQWWERSRVHGAADKGEGGEGGGDTPRKKTRVWGTRGGWLQDAALVTENAKVRQVGAPKGATRRDACGPRQEPRQGVGAILLRRRCFARMGCRTPPHTQGLSDTGACRIASPTHSA